MDRGKTDPGGQVLLAQAFYDEGQYEDAVRVCKQCLLEHAEDAEAQIILSRALIKLARHAEASELLEGLLRGPARRDVHLLHVEVLSERGKRVEAERALSLAEQTWPGDPEIAGYRARLAEAVAVPAERLDEREADPAEAGPDRWNELSAEWGVLLEAHRDEVPDPISDLREPSSHTPSIELLLPPLSDPLAQGMPPLPAEEVWRVSLTHVDDALTVEAAPDSEVAEMFRSDMGGKRAQSRPTHRPLEDAGPLVEADRRAGHPSAGASLTPEPEPDERSRSSPDRPDGAASSARPEQPEFMAGRDLDRQGGSGGSHRFEAPDELSSSTSSEPGAERPGRARPGIEAHAADRTGAGGDAVSTRGARREAASETRAPALGGGAVATARLLDSAELLRSMFEGEDVEAFEAAPLVAPPRPRGRRLALLLLGGGLLLLSAAACVWYVASGRVVERAFEVARRARWSADLGEMRDAELALVRARRYRRAGERLADEIALLQGLQAMVHGKAATPARGASWRGRAARAARALARSQPADAARALSTAIPLRADDRNLQDLLLAWTAWLDGRSGDAHAILAKLGPRLGPAPLFLLLRGFVQLERGEVVAAERAMRSSSSSDRDFDWLNWSLPRRSPCRKVPASTPSASGQRPPSTRPWRLPGGSYTS